MSIRILPAVSASAFLFALCSLASPAHAALDACGGIFVNGNAQCEFKRDQDCQTNCQTVSVEQSCAAQLYTSCASSCTASASTDCTQTCSPVCVTSCSATPGSSSDDICRADCSSDCDAKCAGAAHPDWCHASCTHCCEQKCDDTCRTDDQAQACDTKCGTACTGTCTATANTDCQINCQSTSFESCQTTVVQQCNTSCTDKGGAIFCDGQFLNASNLNDCAAQLAAQVSIHIDVTAKGNVVVDTNGDGKNDVKCSFSPATPRGGGVLGLLLAVGAALGLRRRASR